MWIIVFAISLYLIVDLFKTLIGKNYPEALNELEDNFDNY